MTIRSLRADARNLAAPAKPITRRYTAVYLGVGLLLALTTLICDALIAQTGGLADMQKQAVIRTVETVLHLAAQLFLPLWTVGFTCCALGFARGEAVEKTRLWGGLRRWGGLLRLVLLEAFVYMALSYLLIMGLLTVYIMTPWGVELITVMYAATNVTELTVELEDALLAALEPLYLIWTPIAAVLLLFLSYQFRFALYRLLDHARPGAIRAIFENLRLLRRHRWQLLKLDLSWWWYYLLTALLGGILYLPEVLTLLGITVPMDGNVFYLLCYVAYGLLTWVLYNTAFAKVETSYALLYDRLLNGQLTMDNGQLTIDN